MIDDIYDDREMGPVATARDISAYVLKVFRRRWRYVILPPLGMLLITCVMLAFVTPKYKSTAQVLLIDPATQGLGNADRIFAVSADGATVDSDISLITSQSIAMRVARDARLESDAEFGGHSSSPTTALNIAAENLRKNIVVERPEPYVIAVSVIAFSPAKAQQLTQALVAKFLEDERAVRNSAVAQAKGFWTQRLDFPDVGGRVISAASLPNSPSYPRRLLILLIVAGLSGAASISAVLVLELFDSSVRTIASAEGVTGFKVIGMVPLLKEDEPALGKRDLDDQAARYPRQLFEQVVSSINTILGLWRSEFRNKVVLVTSALSGEGKSTIALAIAAQAAQEGEKVIIVDCDFRHPTISRRFSSIGCGWETVIAGSSGIKETVITDQDTGVALLPTIGNADSSRILLGSGMRDLLVRLRSEYQLVVLDAAPILGAIDALVLMPLADDGIIVVKWGSTSVTSVRSAMKSIQTVNKQTYSVVLNSVDYSRINLYEEGVFGYAYYPENNLMDECYDGW
jgi:capsular exopolysaccharide synthesis family protein